MNLKKVEKNLTCGVFGSLLRRLLSVDLRSGVLTFDSMDTLAFALAFALAFLEGFSFTSFLVANLLD